MEFNEKIQELRKSKGLTQDELAEALFVSRAAVSKWESGRGYPNIDSLKDISKFFCVSIDDLLSGERLLDLAEKENKSNLRRFCDLLFGIADIFSFILIILPLYPNEANGFIHSVSLLDYTSSPVKLTVYWLMFAFLILVGIIKVILVKVEKGSKILTGLSLAVSIFAVVFLASAREVYPVIVVFLLLLIKALILFKCSSTSR